MAPARLAECGLFAGSSRFSRHLRLCPHLVEGTKDLAGASQRRGSNRIHEGSVLRMPVHPKTPPTHTVPQLWGLGFQRDSRGETLRPWHLSKCELVGAWRVGWLCSPGGPDPGCFLTPRVALFTEVLGGSGPPCVRSFPQWGRRSRNTHLLRPLIWKVHTGPLLSSVTCHS